MLAKLAEEHRATPGQLALAWLLAKGPDVVPIPGTRKPVADRRERVGGRGDADHQDVAALTRPSPASPGKVTGRRSRRTGPSVPANLSRGCRASPTELTAGHP